MERVHFVDGWQVYECPCKYSRIRIDTCRGKASVMKPENILECFEMMRVKIVHLFE